jgi:hypothetical protein
MTVMAEVAVEKVFSKLFSFPLLLIISPWLHTNLLLPQDMCTSPEQEAQYHIVGPKLGALTLIQHLE